MRREELQLELEEATEEGKSWYTLWHSRSNQTIHSNHVLQHASQASMEDVQIDVDRAAASSPPEVSAVPEKEPVAAPDDMFEPVGAPLYQSGSDTDSTIE